MYCKYCGRKINSDTTVCKECQRTIEGTSEPQNAKVFYILLFAGPLITIINSVINYLTILLNGYIDGYMKSMIILSSLLKAVLNIHNNFIFYIIIIIILAKRRKIVVDNFNYGDVIIWSGPCLLNIFFSYALIPTLNRMGDYVVAGNSGFSFMHSILTMPGMWYYVCLIVFMLLRSGTIVMKKKTMIILASVLVMWSLLLVLFVSPLIHLFVDATVNSYLVVRSMFSSAASMMWLRHLILLWFAVLLGRREMSFVCGTICLAGFSIIPFLAKTLFLKGGIFVGYGLAETIGYAFVGILLLGVKVLSKHEKQIES